MPFVHSQLYQWNSVYSTQLPILEKFHIHQHALQQISSPKDIRFYLVPRAAPGELHSAGHVYVFKKIIFCYFHDISYSV